MNQLKKKQTLYKRLDIDIKQHEMQKFILIFLEAINKIKLKKNNKDSNNKEETDTDDETKDISAKSGGGLYKFLQRDIDWLELSEIIKVLENIKSYC